MEEDAVESAPRQGRAWLATPLEKLTACVLRAPRAVMLLALVFALLSASLAWVKLGFRGSRLDLLSRHSEFNRRWLNYLDEFGAEDDIVIAVEGAGPDHIMPVLEDLVNTLSFESGTFTSLYYQRDLTRFHAKALHFLGPVELAQLESLLIRVQPVLAGDWSALSATSVTSHASNAIAGGRARETELAREEADWLQSYLQSLTTSLASDQPTPTPWTTTLHRLRQLSQRFSSGYLLSDDGRLGLITLRIRGGHVRADPVRHLRLIVAAAQERHPAVQIGLTGMPILESDEMRASQTDTTWASILSLVGVACIFVAGFGGIGRPLLSVAALVIALAWTLGYTTLAVGHLNILSAAFGVILIGLGVDFSIHYLAQYSERRQRTADRTVALIDTARCVGPGIVSGGLTSSLAFCTAALTQFTGIAELGVIVAGGILFCIASSLIVLPALVLLCDSDTVHPPRTLDFASSLGRLHARPRTLLVCGLVLAAGLGAGSLRLRYDHNLLNLQPADSQSVDWQRKMATRLDRGIWFALSISSSPRQLLERKQKFEQISDVVATEEVVSLVPAASAARSEQIARIGQRLRNLPPQVPVIPVGTREQLLFELRRLHVAGSGDLSSADPQTTAITALRPATFYRRLSGFQQASAHELFDLLSMLRAMADPAPPQLSDLPDTLRTRFIGRRGQHLLRVYGAENLWDMGPLEQFVKRVEMVDAEITGHPIQTYYASRQMQRSFLHAAIYALLAVSIVLMLDFQRVRLWLLAMLPMVLGMLLTFGILGWLDIPLNPANLIVLPLILGIGIDDGVHVIHDYLQQSQSPYRLSNSTATAVILTSATTMIGFGSMMLASHRGLRSLGQVLTIGIVCCLIASLLVLPPLLAGLRDGFSKSR